MKLYHADDFGLLWKCCTGHCPAGKTQDVFKKVEGFLKGVDSLTEGLTVLAESTTTGAETTTRGSTLSHFHESDGLQLPQRQAEGPPNDGTRLVSDPPLLIWFFLHEPFRLFVYLKAFNLRAMASNLICLGTGLVHQIVACSKPRSPDCGFVEGLSSVDDPLIKALLPSL